LASLWTLASQLGGDLKNQQSYVMTWDILLKEKKKIQNHRKLLYLTRIYYFSFFFVLGFYISPFVSHVFKREIQNHFLTKWYHCFRFGFITFPPQLPFIVHCHYCHFHAPVCWRTPPQSPPPPYSKLILDLSSNALVCTRPFIALAVMFKYLLKLCGLQRYFLISSIFQLNLGSIILHLLNI